MQSGGEARAESPRAAGLVRRLLSLAYESLLLAAVLFALAIPFQAASAALELESARPLLQLYLLLAAGLYFVWQWIHGGCTLAMKTWGIRVVTREGRPLSLRHGLYRFIFALAGTALLGLGFAWALVDRDRQFLHDRLAGTRIVRDDE